MLSQASVSKSELSEDASPDDIDELINAIRDGNDDIVINLLNSKSFDGGIYSECLEIASENCHLNIVTIFLSRINFELGELTDVIENIQENIDPQSPHDANALNNIIGLIKQEINDIILFPQFIAAVKNGDTAFVKTYIKHSKYRYNDKDDTGKSALEWAVLKNHSEIISLLFNRINKTFARGAVDKNISHVIWIAYANKNEQLFYKLLFQYQTLEEICLFRKKALEFKIDSSIISNIDRQIIFLSDFHKFLEGAKRDFLPYMQEFVAAHQSKFIHRLGREENPALVIAAAHGSIKAIYYLFSFYNIKSKIFCFNALYVAARNGHVKAVCILLEKINDIDKLQHLKQHFENKDYLALPNKFLSQYEINEIIIHKENKQNNQSNFEQDHRSIIDNIQTRINTLTIIHETNHKKLLISKSSHSLFVKIDKNTDDDLQATKRDIKESISGIKLRSSSF